jgi:hypothetical protein
MASLRCGRCDTSCRCSGTLVFQYVVGWMSASQDLAEELAMPDDRSQALILYVFASAAGGAFRAAVYFVAWAYR